MIPHPKFTLPTNKSVIASHLNLTQEHFSRFLHELSEKGLIFVDGRRQSRRREAALPRSLTRRRNSYGAVQTTMQAFPGKLLTGSALFSSLPAPSVLDSDADA